MKMFFLTCLFFLTACSDKTILFSETSSQKVRICAVGDVGTGTVTQKSVADAMSKEHCDRLIILGDVIYPSGIQSADDPILTKRFLIFMIASSKSTSSWETMIT